MSDHNKKDNNKKSVSPTCPVCYQQRPYYAAGDAELGEARPRLGIIEHIDTCDNLDEYEQGAAVVSCLDNQEMVNFPAKLCEQAADQGWGTYV